MRTQAAIDRRADAATRQPARLRAAGRPPASAPIQRLQHALGNRTFVILLGERSSPRICTPGDRYERQAWRAADHVLRLPETTAHAPRPAPTAPAAGVAGSQSRRLLPAGGRPLAPALRSYFEPRFGYDFGSVRVHTGQAAAASAHRLHAHAYTVGGDVVFGRFAPETRDGRRLIAHELAHVIQQGEAPRIAGGASVPDLATAPSTRGVIQRAETDTSAGCANLEDTRSDVNERINQALRNARAVAGGNATLLRRAFYRELGRNTSLGRTAIEDWASGLSSRKVQLPAQSSTKFAGVSYGLWLQPLFPILNPTMRINDICVGSDKLGHFLQQGYEYYDYAHAPGGSTAAAVSYGESTEAGGFGLGRTGVYSNADLEANRQGLRFYEDLVADPSLSFDIASYINPRWNEEVNPSHYETSVGPVVWRNLLRGAWSGTFTRPGSASPQPILANFAVANNNVTLTGQYAHRNAAGAIVNGTISGRITHNVNSLGAITGVRIDFEWQGEGGSGRGRWTSSSESALDGTWGTATSRNDGGAWGMRRVSRTAQQLPLSAAAARTACLRACEDTFERCIRHSRQGGMTCVAQRSSCMMGCG